MNLINVVMRKKRDGINKISLMLWHRHLGHICRDRMKRLIKEGVLRDLNFLDFDTCVNCIKRKPH